VTRRFALLVNPSSAGGRAVRGLPDVIDEFDRLGAPHRTIETRSLEHAAEEAVRAAEAGETIAALGGDGLIRPIAGALCGADAALAILPAGRGNDLARVLGIPTAPAAAARVAVEGEEWAIDVGDVDGTPFVGIASLGFDSVCNRIANDTRIVKGGLVYLYSALRALAGWKPATFYVTVDGERHEVTGYSVAVANSKAYGGGMYLLPDAVLDDGKLDVLMISEHGKLQFLRGLAKVFKGKHLGSRHARLARGEVVEVRTDRQFVVYADGDPVGATPATISLRNRCLRVIRPRAGA
jgi:YegS/Rv2252/BmrU family lipid kinase